MPDFEYTREPNTVSAALNGFDRLGIDTEFMRERTFFAELCLVQIATSERIYCVDPITTDATDEFWSRVHACNWVLHAGRQDLEVIYQATQQMPRSVFDNQVAAGLLGMPPQMGYAGLIKELFDVDIPKAHTRSNWAARPLPPEQLAYAAEDVEYLLPACDILAERLATKGRLEWAREDSATLLDPTLYDIDPARAIDRVKAARNFDRQHRAAASALASWRETEALRANRPRQWILRDAVLLSLASRLPDSLTALDDIPDLPPGLVRRAGDQLLQAIHAPPSDTDDYQPAAKPNERQKALLKHLQQIVERRAGELNLAVEILAPRKELAEAISQNVRNSRAFNGWRRDIIGNELLDELS